MRQQQSEFFDFNVFGMARVTAPVFVSRGNVDSGVGRAWAPRRRMLSMNLGSAPDRDAPLVSCLMLTRDRTSQAKIAVRLYRKQTWRNRELVVIDSGSDDALAEWLATLGDPSIRRVKVDAAAFTLGDLRNMSVAEARGDYICQWDDDDLHHPARIEAQMAALRGTDTRLCLLLREIVWYPGAAALSINQQRAHEHTLICHKAALPQFPALPRGEDTPVVHDLLITEPFAMLNLPEMYIYVVHGSNTWGNDHMRRIWERSSHRIQGPAYAEMFHILSRCYPLAEYLQAIGHGVAPPVLVMRPAPLASRNRMPARSR